MHRASASAECTSAPRSPCWRPAATLRCARLRSSRRRATFAACGANRACDRLPHAPEPHSLLPAGSIPTRRAPRSSSRRSPPALATCGSSRTPPPMAERCSPPPPISLPPWWTGSERRCYDPRLPPVMKSESLVYAAAGTLVGFLGGWIIGSQHTIAGAPPAAITAPAPTAAAPAGTPPPAPPPDNAKVQAAATRASSEPSNPAPRIELGNLYFDAEQYQEAARW